MADEGDVAGSEEEGREEESASEEIDVDSEGYQNDPSLPGPLGG